MLREEGVSMVEGIDGSGNGDARPALEERRPVRKSEFRTILKSDECIKRLKASVSGEGEMLGEVHRSRFSVWKRSSSAYSPVFQGRVRDEESSTVITGSFKSSFWKKFFLPLLFIAVVASLVTANLNHINTGIPTFILVFYGLVVPVYFFLGFREEKEILNYLKKQLELRAAAAGL